jgi:hypothetical protein
MVVVELLILLGILVRKLEFWLLQVGIGGLGSLT